jgi:hypothetical protein
MPVPLRGLPRQRGNPRSEGLCDASIAASNSLLQQTALWTTTAFSGGWARQQQCVVGDPVITIVWSHCSMRIVKALTIQVQACWQHLTTSYQLPATACHSHKLIHPATVYRRLLCIQHAP